MLTSYSCHVAYFILKMICSQAWGKPETVDKGVSGEMNLSHTYTPLVNSYQ